MSLDPTDKKLTKDELHALKSRPSKKNLSSAKDYDILKHLSQNQDAMSDINSLIYSPNKYDSKTDDLRNNKKKGSERPGAMRMQAVDKYINQVYKQEEHDGKIEIIKKMYLLNMDNRILNNLRKQLNEMIEDEAGLVSVEEFEKLFFTYFKGNANAFKIY